jgi:signal transduction histidine kinase/ABC-type multidrug transport system ATPase subunit
LERGVTGVDRRGGDVPGDVALRVSDLSLSYGARPALQDVNLAVRAGELLAVVGENGAGKSTLVGCLSGALTPQRGTVVVYGRDPATAFHSGDLTVVWQDLALCDNLSVTGNLFLGSELGRVFLSRRKMDRRVLEILVRVGLGPEHLRRRIGEMSGGERQAVAIARALMVRPRVLVLDEPTAALGVQQTHRIERLLRDLRRDGLAIILVSHRIEQVFGLADRVVALRHGRVIGDLSTVEAHVDDIIALMSGLEVDSVARRHLTQLSGLVDQLAEVEPSASLPIIVTALSTAMGNQKLYVHLVSPDAPDELVLRAWVGAQESDLAGLRRVRVGRPGGGIGEAAASSLPVVAEDLRLATTPGSASMWSVPIQAAGEVYGVLSGLANVPGRPQDDQIRLASVYASLAATAIERERLLNDFTRRNRVLESLRGVLAALAGPGTLPSSLGTALDALALGLGARSAALVERTGPDRLATHATSTTDPRHDPRTIVWVLSDSDAKPRPGGDPNGLSTKVVPFSVDGRDFFLGVEWPTASERSADAEELLVNAVRSLRLAVQRDLAQAAQAETELLRRIRDLQSEFIRRLSHELRTPLTAITGYATTLRATDVTWDPESQRRFLDAIVSVSQRMSRLVGDLLDTAAISSGNMTLHHDWCDMRTVLRAAVNAVPDRGQRVTMSASRLAPLWGDHDRLEQVLVNLIDNAVTHGGPHITVEARVEQPWMIIEVTDDGPGIPATLRDSAFLAYVRGDTEQPGAGLGLAICKAIVEAHQGELTILDVDKGATVRVTLPLRGGPEGSR